MDNISETILINPIGYLRNNLPDTETIPPGGQSSVIELKKEYQSGLLEIEKYGYLWILSWIHLADRSLLRVRPSKVNPDLKEYGVFALRSPVRPNPIGLTLAKLDKVDGCNIYVSNVDLVDSTPVLDIKPYFPNDIIFSPKSAYIPPKNPDLCAEFFRQKILRHHGEECLGAELAIRMAVLAEKHFGNIQDEDVKLSVFKDACLADSLQGLTLARLANPPRFFFDADRRNKQAIWRKEKLFLRIIVYPHVDLALAKEAPVEEIFLIDTGILRDKNQWIK